MPQTNQYEFLTVLRRNLSTLVAAIASRNDLLWSQTRSSQIAAFPQHIDMDWLVAAAKSQLQIAIASGHKTAGPQIASDHKTASDHRIACDHKTANLHVAVAGYLQ